MRNLVKFFAALADPTRLRLLNMMAGGEVCVCHFQGVLQTNQPKISRHLAYLKKAGLVEARRDGKWMHYRLKKQERELEKILAVTLEYVGREGAVRSDVKRLKQICCTPEK
ncbi:ArsR/SmtB family transcription factor [Pedosphaera parvula]|nr:metalloregulator ArsR/SmtB family transcription factor [Pedosphaera parvula]